MTPTNLVCVTSSIRVPFITVSSIHRDEFLGVKSMKLVLSIFSDDLYAFTQAYIFAISSFIWWLRSLRPLPVQNRLYHLQRVLAWRARVHLADHLNILHDKSKQGKSEGCDSCDKPNWIQIIDFFARMVLKFDGLPRKTTRRLFYAMSRFVQHFKAIGEFKLELQSRNAQFGVKINFFLSHATLHYTASMLLISFFKCESHTAVQYSSLDLIVAT